MGQRALFLLDPSPFRSSISPAHWYLSVYALQETPYDVPARLEARMQSLFYFPAGLFQPYDMPVYPGALR
jgi:hypothetical protein